MELTSYKQEYYAPEQVRLYIGPIWIDDCVDITFNHANTKMQDFDHRAKFFNLVMPGQNLVEGQFRILFKESNSILKILNSLKEKVQSMPRLNFVNRAFELIAIKRNYQKVDYLNSPVIAYDTEDELVRIMSLGYSVYSEEYLNMNRDFTIDDILDVPLFDIYLIYGNPNNPLLTSTVRVISNVAITGIGKSIMLEQNITEDYSFIGRFLDKPFNYSMKAKIDNIEEREICDMVKQPLSLNTLFGGYDFEGHVIDPGNNLMKKSESITWKDDFYSFDEKTLYMTVNAEFKHLDGGGYELIYSILPYRFCKEFNLKLFYPDSLNFNKWTQFGENITWNVDSTLTYIDIKANTLYPTKMYGIKFDFHPEFTDSSAQLKYEINLKFTGYSPELHGTANLNIFKPDSPGRPYTHETNVVLNSISDSLAFDNFNILARFRKDDGGYALEVYISPPDKDLLNFNFNCTIPPMLDFLEFQSNNSKMDHFDSVNHIFYLKSISDFSVSNNIYFILKFVSVADKIDDRFIFNVNYYIGSVSHSESKEFKVNL
ncbi:MAG: hypothetical protein ACTSWR_11505 [Candidatus Helarchaeota archaeon]